jgi:hypothetical protein
VELWRASAKKIRVALTMFLNQKSRVWFLLIYRDVPYKQYSRFVRFVSLPLCTLTFFFTFQETKRPSKEMVVTIARQLCLQATTVGNFFMNSRRRSSDKWQEESHDDDDDPMGDEDDDTADEECPMDAVQQHNTKQQIQYHLQQHHAQQAAQSAAGQSGHDEI